MTEHFASNYEVTEDRPGIAYKLIEQREQKVRAGLWPPADDEERRQAIEGWRPPSELDCAKGWRR